MSYLSDYDRYEFLERAETVDEATWHQHVSAFIKNFVVQAKRQRWHYLCLEKPEKGRQDALKMYSDLIRPLGPKLDYEDLTKRKGKGIYYAFSGQAWWLSPEDAIRVGHGHESIFSMKEGEFIIYFWHEMQEFLCQKEAQLHK